MASKSKVYFFFERKIGLKNRRSLKNFIEKFLLRNGKKLHYLNYVFCSDNELLSINRRYLKHNYYTDVITFELSDASMPLEGEIYISVDRVKENARIIKEPINRELHRVIFHGVLHLCGFNDKNEKEKKLMQKMELKCLHEYFEFSRDTVSR